MSVRWGTSLKAQSGFIILGSCVALLSFSVGGALLARLSLRGFGGVSAGPPAFVLIWAGFFGLSFLSFLVVSFLTHYAHTLSRRTRTARVVLYACCALAVIGATWFSVLLDIGTYDNMGRPILSFENEGVWDFVLGGNVTLSPQWPFFRRWARDFAGTSLAGMMWTLPAGTVLFHLGWGFDFAFSGLLYGVFEEVFGWDLPYFVDSQAQLFFGGWVTLSLSLVILGTYPESPALEKSFWGFCCNPRRKAFILQAIPYVWLTLAMALLIGSCFSVPTLFYVRCLTASIVSLCFLPVSVLVAYGCQRVAAGLFSEATEEETAPIISQENVQTEYIINLNLKVGEQFRIRQHFLWLWFSYVSLGLRVITSLAAVLVVLLCLVCLIWRFV